MKNNMITNKKSLMIKALIVLSTVGFLASKALCTTVMACSAGFGEPKVPSCFK